MPDKIKIKNHTYYVKGMHCASCELIVEKKLIAEEGIKAVDASTTNNQVVVGYENSYPRADMLNKMFKEEGYVFSDDKIKGDEEEMITKNDGHLVVNKQKLYDSLVVIGTSLLLVIVFIFLSKSGLTALVSVNGKSALPMFLLFGLLAGISSCAALVGGIVLSMSKQWSDIYDKDETMIKKLQPHFLFNLGRLVSYWFLGGLLGALGSAIQLSLTFGSILIFGVSVMMIFLALEMLGVKYFRKFQLRPPKFITRHIANEKSFSGRYMPAVMGALTFFLPCGFTITAQGLALASGSAVQGSLIMLFFAIGTLPMLLTIGMSSVKLFKRPHLAGRFLKVAGVLVLFFALFNINSQLNVLGFSSLDDIKVKTMEVEKEADNGLPAIIGGKQVLAMDALAYGYEPNQLKVRAGIPVRWEITDKGTSGCTNAIISRGLFDGEIALTPGQTSIKEFTPNEPGRYKFSCWMGMVSGVIEVVEDDGKPLDSSAGEIIPSGSQGCGCGGGGAGTCGG